MRTPESPRHPAQRTCACREETACFRGIPPEGAAFCHPCAVGNHAHGYGAGALAESGPSDAAVAPQPRDAAVDELIAAALSWVDQAYLTDPSKGGLECARRVERLRVAAQVLKDREAPDEQ